MNRHEFWFCHNFLSIAIAGRTDGNTANRLTGILTKYKIMNALALE